MGLVSIGAKFIGFIGLVFWIAQPGFTQNKTLLKWKAGRATVMGDYKKAVGFYHKLVNADSTDAELLFNLGSIYLNELQRFDSAAFYLSQAHSLDKSSQIRFEYARCLRMIEEPTKALVFFDSLTKAKEFLSDKVAMDLLNQEIIFAKNAIHALDTTSKHVMIDNMGFEVNWTESEYTPVYIQADGTVMYNGRYQDYAKEDRFQDNLYMENVYYYDPEESVVSVYDQTIEQTGHFAIVGPGREEEQFLVFKENQLWLATREEKRLKNIEPLALPHTYYFVPHGTFSTTGDTLVFSAKPTEQDDLDLYITTMKNGQWTAPVKIENLSSEKDEDSPNFSANGKTLYFSSKGFGSCGGYDVYKSILNNSQFEIPQSLGYPINSAGEDIYYMENQDQSMAYMASNRAGGFGLMDLYVINLKPKPFRDCQPYENAPLLVQLDISESIDSNSVPLKYIWRFEDGSIAKGVTVDKTFDFAGKQMVYLDLIDVESQTMETHTMIDSVIIEGVDFIGFASPYFALPNEPVEFDANVASVEGIEWVDYGWMVNGEPIDNHTAILSYTFQDTGIYLIELGIIGLNEEKSYVSYCYEREITIVNKLHDWRDVYDKEGFPNLYQESTYVDNEQKNDAILDQTLKDQLTNHTDFDNPNDLVDNLDNLKLDSMLFEPIYFKFDRYDLSNKATDKMDNLVQYINSNPNAQLIICGHTDSKGSAAYNKTLAKKRANAAYSYLKTNGVEESRVLRLINYGESRPAEANTTPDGRDNFVGRQKNRRVEFIIVFK